MGMPHLVADCDCGVEPDRQIMGMPHLVAELARQPDYGNAPPGTVVAERPVWRAWLAGPSRGGQDSGGQ